MKRFSRVVPVLIGVVFLVSACGGGSSSEDVVVHPDIHTTDDTGGDPDIIDDAGSETIGPQCAVNDDCLALYPDPGPCKAAVCDATGQCSLKNRKNYAFCDDGNACTAGEACIEGECDGGVAVSADSCDDGNPCTDDSCDPAEGCMHAANSGASCDDGNACTDTDTCSEGVCVGSNYVCDPCEIDADCAAFEDGDQCNGLLRCVEGACQIDQATLVVCAPSSDACQGNLCVPATGLCELAPVENGASCDDGNPCTNGEQCSGGDCAGGDYVCGQCQEDAECTGFDDGDMCNGTVVCIGGECIVDPVTVVSCEPPEDACLIAVCDPTNGACLSANAPSGTPCDDGDACTGPDRCEAGLCDGATLSIDDGDACTTDACDTSDGISHTPVALNDDDACTIDACDSETGDITHAPLSEIDDDNACTIDSCDSATGEVTHTPLEGIDDGDACTVDSCNTETGDIAHEPLAIDDSDPCTLDLCDSATGAVTHNPIPELDDSDACTVDTCDAGTGAIAHDPLAEIDDGDACTEDLCDPSDGRITHPFLASINDGDPCTDDMCDAATGDITHPPLAVIDDDNPCTDDLCDSTTGLITHPAADGVDDGDECTQDLCDTGTGEITHLPLDAIDDGNACTDDTCNSLTGEISHDPLEAIDDGDACTVDSCDTETGNVSHDPLEEIDDEDACTIDSCDTGTGDVTHEPLEAIDDGDACTIDSCDSETGAVTHEDVEVDDEDACTIDRCNSETGDVTHEPLPEIDDEDACTMDGCNAQTGDVTHEPLEEIDDEDACTIDSCDSETGAVAHEPLDEIDDEDLCTTDTCDPATGAVSHDDVVCDDEIDCTLDRCDSADGQCVFDTADCECTEAAQCDSGNPCEVPTCNERYECTYENVADDTPCDDGDACSEETSCQSGTCTDGYSVCFSCASPRVINEPGRYYGSNADMTDDHVGSCRWSDLGKDAVWAYDAVNSGPLCVDTLGTGLDDSGMGLDLDTLLYARAVCEEMDELACNDDIAYFVSTSRIELDVEAGERYFLIVDANSSRQGDYVLNVREAPCPESSCVDGIDNDSDGETDCFDAGCERDPACTSVEVLCEDGLDNDVNGLTDCDDPSCGVEPFCEATCSAPGIIDGPGSYEDSTEGLADRFQPSCVDPTSESPEAVWAITADESGYFCLNTEGSALGDTVLSAYDDCPGGAELTCNAEMAFHSELEIHVEAGQTRYVMIEGVGGAEGDYTLNVTAGHCIERLCSDGVDNDEDGETDCQEVQCDGIDGCELGGELTCHDGIDNDSDGDADCFDSECRTDSLCVNFFTCTSPALIGPIPEYGLSLAGSTTDLPFTNEPSCIVGGFAPEAVWLHEASEDALLCVTVEGIFGETVVHVREHTDPMTDPYDACAQQVNEIACDQANGGPAEVTIRTAPGGYYFLFVDSYNFQYFGDYVLDIQPGPCVPEGLACEDGVDNDLDGDTDCDDNDCVADPFCCGIDDSFDDGGGNDDVDHASLVTVGEHSVMYSDVDWYRVALSAGEIVVLDVLLWEHPPADLDMELRSPSGVVLEDAVRMADGMGWERLTYANTMLEEVHLEVTSGGEAVCGASYSLFVETHEGDCTDGLDNDDDGVADCCDEDCDSESRCAAEWATGDPVYHCSDGLDNDCDGDTDCFDASCDGVGFCENGSELSCDDDFDNDGDGLTDCDDTADCYDAPNCEPELVCDDGLDDDEDGSTDCADNDCCVYDANPYDDLCRFVPGPCLETCPAGPHTAITCGETLSGQIDGVGEIAAYACNENGFIGLGGASESVFLYEALFDGKVTVALDDPSDDLIVLVLEDSCDAASCEDDSDWSSDFLTFDVSAGRTYYIVVDGWAGASSSFSVSLSCTEVIPLACGSVRAGNTAYSVDSMSSYEGSCSESDMGGKDVVYEIVTPDGFAGDITLSLDDTGYDPLELFLGNIVGSPTGCLSAGGSGDAIVDYTLAAGESYYANVDGPTYYPGGPYTLTLDCDGVDTCGEDVVSRGDTITGSTAGEPALWDVYDACGVDYLLGPEAVYDFTPVSSGTAFVELTSGEALMTVLIIDGCDPSQCLGMDEGTGVIFSAVAGHTYYVVVDGEEGVEGAFTFDIL